MLDLYHATRDELIRIMLDQHDQLADRERHFARQDRELAELRQALATLTARIGELTAELIGHDDPPARGTPPGMPGHQPTQVPARAPRAQTPGHGS